MNGDDRNEGVNPSADGAQEGTAPTLRDRVRSLRLKDGEAAPSNRSWLPWSITVVALSVTALFAYYAYRVAPTKVAPKEDPSTASASAAGDVVLESKGYVVAAHQFKLSPQSGGEIVWLDPNFSEGTIYHKGEVLAVVDPTLYKARVDKARAGVENARVLLEGAKTGSSLRELLKARALLKYAEARHAQMENQERRTKDAGSGSTIQQQEDAVFMAQQEAHNLNAARSEVDRALDAQNEKIKSLRAQYDQAVADLVDAEKQRDNCSIVAPVDGSVLSKNAELGAYVSPLAFGAAGYLCEMADLSDLEIELDVQERDIPRVRPGQRCRIMLEAYQRDREFLETHPNGYEGEVSRLMPQANRAKGAITVRVKVKLPSGEAPGSYMRPDMGVLVSFLKTNR
jgi:multidrug resistance efflux pump